MQEAEHAAGRLDDLVLNGYRHVVESGQWDVEQLRRETGAPLDELDEARRSLAALRVIERDAVHGTRWRAVSPRVAMARLVTPIEAEVRQRAAQAESLRMRLQMLLPVHEAQQRSDPRNAVEAVTHPDALAALLREEAAGCRGEVMQMDNGVDDIVRAERWLADAVARKVRARVVVPHSRRYDRAFDGGPPGVELRTADEPPIGMVIFDDTSCVLFSDGADGESELEVGGERGRQIAVVIRNRLVVGSMTVVFEQVWGRAHAYRADRPQTLPIASELQRAIVRLLADGAKDELVARRLGMSLRTCRRRISALMVELGATSRFQAGVEATRRTLK